MPKGIKISKDKSIDAAEGKDFAINTLYPGSMKVKEIVTIPYGGESTVMSSTFGLSARIQKYPHGLGYAPAYLAYLLYGNIDVPTSIQTPFNDFITAGGESHFINVNATEFIIGFDVSIPSPVGMRIVIFAERLSDQ